MAQDNDVARMAAAMNTPGFKYRSFGNEPVRVRPGVAGTLAPQNATPAVEDQMQPSALLLALDDASPAMPQTSPPEPSDAMAFDEAPASILAYDAFPAAQTALPKLDPTLPPLDQALPPLDLGLPPLSGQAPAQEAPAPLPEPPPAPPLFSWPESSAAPLPPTAAPALLALAQPAGSLPATGLNPPDPAGGFRLLESIGHQAEDGAPSRAEAPASGTLARLRRGAATADAGPPLSLPGTGGAWDLAAQAPIPAAAQSHPSGLLPAAAVAVPLSDVMRLIAAGATPPPSPFDAFRAALGAQPGR
ncbi:MAG: hypothetical protein H7345_11370 [Rubritepida sp.]|nr:hypothetical protein [Rubritepida sp.]